MKDCKTFLRVTKFERDWKKMILSKPETTTIQKKRYLEGCACAGAALKIYRIKAKVLYEKKSSSWKVKFSSNQQTRAI